MYLAKNKKYLFRFLISETLILILVPLSFFMINNWILGNTSSYLFLFITVFVGSFLTIFNLLLSTNSEEQFTNKIKFQAEKDNKKRKTLKKITVARFCPECKNLSNIDAEFCRYCGKKISKKVIICPSCSKLLDIDEESCQYCGVNITEKGIVCPYCSNYVHVNSGENTTFCEHCGKKIENISDKVEIRISRISEYLDEE